MDMLCPKCQGQMRQYERNNIVIDQCTSCRGIFLDRGELEHLLDAEAQFNQARQAPPAPRYDDRPPKYREERRYDDRRYDDRRYDDKRYKKKKRESFLGELFDF
ncbi:TFIIB-type zinc ribbon-containing protein [Salininema proteolyticum]|uniref:Zf-TFIIB domain-containing protein n=1 Tax=Salininema proteolyticum TaxID=1607685 RepID=A0ABV8TTE2_9ACTN